MRVITWVGLILCALAVAAAAHASKGVVPTQVAAVRELERREGPGWVVDWNSSTGTPASMSSRSPRAKSTSKQDPHEAALAFLDRNRAVFGTRPDVDGWVTSAERVVRGLHHVQVIQTYQGIPVADGEYAITVGDDGGVRMLNGRAYPNVAVDIHPTLAKSVAEAGVSRLVAGGARDPDRATRLVIDRSSETYRLAWEIGVRQERTSERFLVCVDAHTGASLRIENVTPHDSAPIDDGPQYGRVFAIDGSAPPITVVLPDVGVYGLGSVYVDVLNDAGECARPDSSRYFFDPADPHFAEVNIYYHLDRYLAQFLPALGYQGLGYRLKAHANSNLPTQYIDSQKSVYYASGDGVSVRNFGLASDVVIHEAQHAVTFAAGIGYEGLETQELNEAISDYFAAAYTNDPKFGEWIYLSCSSSGVTWLDTDPSVFNYAHPEQAYDCFGTAGGPTYPVGMILSGALWDLRTAIGPATDAIVLAALDYCPAHADFACLADAIVQADLDHFGGAHQIEIATAFANRGIEGFHGGMTGPATLQVGATGTYTLFGFCEVCPITAHWTSVSLCAGVPCGPRNDLGTGSTLDVVGADDFRIRVDVTDLKGRSLSESLSVNVLHGSGPALSAIQGPLVITRQVPTTYKAIATGYAPLRYRWDRRYTAGGGSTSFVTIPGAVSDTITISEVSNFDLRAFVTDADDRFANKFISVRVTAPSAAVDGAAVESARLDGGTVLARNAEVAFEIRERMALTLSVHDVSGRDVRTLAHGDYAAGRHPVAWSTEGLSPGVYFYRLAGSGLNLARRFIVLR